MSEQNEVNTDQEVIEDKVEVAEEVKIMGETVEETPENQIASQADVNAVLDAVKELTKIVGDLHKENVKWFRAGKMGGA